MSRRVLGVFAKWPQPGAVKTRLATARSPEWAAHVADAFLRDTLSRLSTIAAHRVIVFAPLTAEHFFADLVRGQFDLVPQCSGDLGQRLSTFVEAQFQTGASAVVLVGCDSPTLPVEFVERAFAELTKADVVLGPAADGGYYLIGCKKGKKGTQLFSSISWGTSAVLGETVARVVDAGLRLTVLPPWYDVDTLDDWRMLRGHLRALRHAGIDPGVPLTEALRAEEEP
jgi:uncharacterized protein